MSTPDDPFDLNRFVAAQDGCFDAVLRELRAGAKRTHWMWFVFPQIRGLGRSPMAELYAIRSREEAEAYLAHPVLGARLDACVDILAALPIADAAQVFGAIDAVKLRSSLTLFIACGAKPPYRALLDRWFAGAMDEATLGRLA